MTDGHCDWCQWDMWEDRESGMHQECEAKWERRLVLRTFIDPIVDTFGDQINVDTPGISWSQHGARERKAIDIALLIEQYMDSHTGG